MHPSTLVVSFGGTQQHGRELLEGIGTIRQDPKDMKSTEQIAPGAKAHQDETLHAKLIQLRGHLKVEEKSERAISPKVQRTLRNIGCRKQQRHH
jgi:hypothetical protein